MNLPMIHSFIKTLTGPCMIGRGESVLACCSGGIDSMVLLDLLMQASGPLGLKVGVAHVDHGIREEASRKDAVFVSDHCKRLGIPCHVYELGLSPTVSNLEEQARNGRYGKIAECMRVHGYAAAATGHTLDDQAETIVYRLVRGSGIRGLAGMEFRVRSGIVRPMLGFTRQQVEEHARAQGIGYVEDSTNLDTTLTRNLIRHEIIPLMKRINPLAAASIARLGEIAREEGGLLDELSLVLEGEALEVDWGLVRAYRLGPLENAPTAVLKRMLIRATSSLVREPRGIDALQVEEIVKVVKGRKAGHTVMRRVAVTRDEDALVFCPAGQGPFYRVEIPGPGLYTVAPLGVSVRIGFEGAPAQPMVLRAHAKGERIDGRKVVKLLADKGVTKSLRPFWPVLAAGDEVVSIAGVFDHDHGMKLFTEFPLRAETEKDKPYSI